jgi:hypothetical protein
LLNGGVTKLERRLTPAFSAASSESAHIHTHQPLARRATMRKVLITLVAAASAVAVAAPASAQVFGNIGVGIGTPGYGYGGGYGNGYGYNDYGQVRSLQYRVNAIQRQIEILDRRDVLSEREARRLREQSRNVERRLYRAASYGLNPYEARDLNYQIARLEQRVQREAWDRDGRYGRRDGYYGDRDWDRDGRWDRDRD